MLLLQPHLTDALALSGLFDAGADYLGFLVPVFLLLVLLAVRVTSHLVLQVVSHGLLLQLLQFSPLRLLLIE